MYEVQDLDFIPEGMVGLKVPRQQYIHYRPRGPVEEIYACFGRMIAWAQAKGHTLEFKIEFQNPAMLARQGYDLYLKVIERRI